MPQLEVTQSDKEAEAEEVEEESILIPVGATDLQIRLVSVPTLLMGRNYILKWVFFVQTIFADRYIHRRELRLVSLESWSSVEYGIKKIFVNFRFLQGVIEV